MRDERTTNEQTLKIELLSQWKLEAEFRNFNGASLSDIRTHRSDPNKTFVRLLGCMGHGQGEGSG